jgi:predicted ATP-dependent protease
VERGEFHIYPVKRIEEAMELLTGVPAGKRRKDGRLPTGTIYHLVNKRLTELAEAARQHGIGRGRVG